MTDFLSLLTAIPGLLSNFRGSANPYGEQQRELAGRQNQISAALTEGPSNPLYHQLYGQYEQQNKNNLAQTIAEAQGQNRMNANMGRTPLFSNERGSENIFRSLMQGYQGLGAQADQQTRQSLMGAANPTIQAQSSYASLIPQTNAAASQNIQGYKDIYNLLRGQQQQSPYAGAGNYSGGGNNGPQNQNYQDPNAGGFPKNQDYGLNYGAYGY